MTVSQRIFDTAKEKRISLTNLSRETGIPVPTLSSWKQRNTCPSSDKLAVIAECLEVSVEYLLGIGDAPTSNNVVAGSSNTIQNGNNNIIELRAEGALTINNPAVAEAYESLTEREKLSVQMFILDTAEAKKKKSEA